MTIIFVIKINKKMIQQLSISAKHLKNRQLLVKELLVHWKPEVQGMIPDEGSYPNLILTQQSLATKV